MSLLTNSRIYKKHTEWEVKIPLTTSLLSDKTEPEALEVTFKEFKKITLIYFGVLIILCVVFLMEVICSRRSKINRFLHSVVDAIA